MGEVREHGTGQGEHVAHSWGCRWFHGEACRKMRPDRSAKDRLKGCSAMLKPLKA